MYNTEDLQDFIDADAIWNHIERAEKAEPQEVREVLAKALDQKGLDLYDAAGYDVMPLFQRCYNVTPRQGSLRHRRVFIGFR